MNSIRHQLDEIHALDSKETEEPEEEVASVDEPEENDEEASPKEESPSLELPSPPQMESQSLDEPEIPSVTTDELSDPVENLPQGEVEAPSVPDEEEPAVDLDTTEPVVEQSTEGLIDEPSIPAGGEVDQSSLSLSGDDDVPSPPVLDAPEEDPVEEENTQPPEPEVPQQDADFGLPKDSDDQVGSEDDGTLNPTSVAEPSSTLSSQNQELQDTDPFGKESLAQMDQQHQHGQDFVKSLADSLDPAFNELRTLQQQYVYDYVQRQVLVTTLNGRVY